ncbi:KATNB1-like protein 1 isoform X3 [Cyprinodon tularosa]|uniref:KATNB1-like protein 1 isoform X3 n=1 Tax=Cyprinodon tularosa TaxID=77115 RepID=UPI0018E1E1DF|nr:KATNB1-like protein 1 isoform X3 [Cyprinodon tularosa]
MTSQTDLMDSSCKGSRDHYVDPVLHYEEAQYTVSYARRRNSEEVDYDKHEDFNKKRHSVNKPGNGTGRVKRVLSCKKKKTHQLTVARRKQHLPGRNFDSTHKENETKRMQDKQQETFFNDPSEFPLNLTKDHNMVVDVLFGRNLRLKVALTLWKRNVGELLAYFQKIQDTGVIVDFLPIICKCIDEGSPRINIGCCVDLFPLVRKVLCTPYEEYLKVGFEWIYSVLKHWWGELQRSGYSGSSKPQLDENFQVSNRQLREIWHQEPLLKSVTGQTGDIAKVVDSFVFQLR